MERCTKCDIIHDTPTYDCPLCEANDRIFDLEREIDNLEKDIDELKGTIADLEMREEQ
jgi:transcription initiation factor IIE alpha subunit